MFHNRVWILLLVLVVILNGVVAVDNTTDNLYPTLNSSWSYCFEYTWLGPQYDRNSEYNGTCDDYSDEYRLGETIPCSSPLVISDDGTVPDKEYLWQNHKASVLCRRSQNQRCVSYTYWQDGLITNQTHMCARVRSNADTNKNECYKQKTNGYEVELCICSSSVGLGSLPCNSGPSIQASFMMIIFIKLLYDLLV